MPLVMTFLAQRHAVADAPDHVLRELDHIAYRYRYDVMRFSGRFTTQDASVAVMLKHILSEILLIGSDHALLAVLDRITPLSTF